MQFAVLLTLGLSITFYFTYHLVIAFRKTRPPKGWPVAEGRMLLLKGDQALLPSRLNRMPGVMLVYQYEVNGVEYTSTWHGLVPRLKDKLLQAEHLEVYYNPSDPSVNFLEGKVPPVIVGLHLGMTAIGLMIATASLYTG